MPTTAAAWSSTGREAEAATAYAAAVARASRIDDALNKTPREAVNALEALRVRHARATVAIAAARVALVEALA